MAKKKAKEARTEGTVKVYKGGKLIHEGEPPKKKQKEERINHGWLVDDIYRRKAWNS